MKKPLHWVFYSAVFSSLLFSCNKNSEPLIPQQQVISSEQPVNPDIVESAKTVSAVMAEMYKDPATFALVNEAIAAEYYTDDRMPLKDLLYPENSQVFKNITSKNARLAASNFREKFNSILSGKKREAGSGARAKAYDEDYFVSNGITIYFPYSRWFKGKKSSSITIVTAPEIDADVAPGVEYKQCGTEVCSTNITADEKYIQTHPTHVVQAGGADVAKYKLSLSPVALSNSGARQQAGFMKVYIAGLRCIKQYDAAFSLTGNGGGSEIKISRVSGYLKQDSSGQITSPENVVSYDIPRDLISLGLPVYVGAEWDQNWEEGDTEQYFAIYEEDNKGTSEYSGQVKTTVGKAGQGTGEGTLGFKITVSTQDEIIVQHGWTRAPFIAGSRINNGWGFDPNTNGIFANGPWAWYDGPVVGGGGANVSYCLPYQNY